ncbi:MAG: hypothetical protein KA052_03190 [Candidatus Pacebacteria bacterium]|nr:hypothetical protein [Candidatus Paceibacterota bacterium]
MANKSSVIKKIAINDVPEGCGMHNVNVFEFPDHFQVYGEAPCDCGNGTHEILYIKDLTMDPNHALYPVVFHGVRLKAYKDESGREKHYYYDFRHKAIFTDLPRVIDGSVTFEW